MKQLLFALLLPLLCSGCLSTSQNYVDEHYRGYSIVRGHLTKVEALESSKWEHLADGVAVEVAMPGCTIHIQQGEDEERTRTRTFELHPGDRIVWGRDGDLVLYALEDNKPAGGPGTSPPASAAPPTSATPAGQ